MTSQPSTTPGRASGGPPDGAAARSGVPNPQLVSRTPPAGGSPQARAGSPQGQGGSPQARRPPTWGQLQTPPQGAAYARPASARPHEPEAEQAPLFGGALSAKEPPMRMRLLVALCGWAAGVTLVGLGVGLWALIKLMSYGTPAWFEPVIILTGLTGIGFAIAAFVNAEKRHLPWYLMGASTAVLFVAIGLTAAV